MRVPILAYSAVCSLGADEQEVSKNLFSPSAGPSFVGARLESVYSKTYPVFSVSPQIISQKKEDESYGFLFLRTAADAAIKSAGFSKEDLQNLRVGIAAGTTVDASFNCFDFYKSYRKDSSVSPEPLLHYLHTPLSGALQKYLGVNGPQITITTACASGTDAIGLGAQWIEEGLCDIVIACGTDEINMIPFTGFIRLMIASKEHCAPFSAGRTGINLGEGAGVIVLASDKFKERAKGYVLGYGTSADAYHATAPDPSGAGLKRAMKMALGMSKIKKEDIAFINAHGTGTQDNDAAEAKVFKELIPGVPIMATKSRTGHTLGAAGAVEAVLSLIALNKKEIPATLNFLGEDSALCVAPVLENTKIEKRIALSDSLAFGGCNSVIVLEGKDE